MNSLRTHSRNWIFTFNTVYHLKYTPDKQLLYRRPNWNTGKQRFPNKFNLTFAKSYLRTYLAHIETHFLISAHM